MYLYPTIGYGAILLKLNVHSMFIIGGTDSFVLPLASKPIVKTCIEFRIILCSWLITDHGYINLWCLSQSLQHVHMRKWDLCDILNHLQFGQQTQQMLHWYVCSFDHKLTNVIAT